ncbi:MAG: hypothetical protein JAY72_21185 [Candidatus Thiodiazotropha endolucinida]|nr:hypothetical protein [Candidatus Thiodiazotropha taylori]MCW4324198.1 hypothetical protein [Candidatus Thiodiazotropha taylori]
MIEETINTVVSSLFPSSGDNLLGMDIDICHYFESNTKLKFISRRQTGDPGCMFVVHLEATEDAHDIADISSALEEVWDNLAYSYFESRTIKKYKRKAVLRFVTVIDENSFYVTGNAIVTGNRYEKLAAEYGNNFFELPEHDHA